MIECKESEAEAETMQEETEEYDYMNEEPLEEEQYSESEEIDYCD